MKRYVVRFSEEFNDYVVYDRDLEVAIRAFKNLEAAEGFLLEVI